MAVTGGTVTSGASRDVLGRGLRVLGRAIRTEPRLFTIGGRSAACLFGLLIIANAYVVGAVVGRRGGSRVQPAPRRRRPSWAWSPRRSSGISVLRVASIFGRRLGAGYMQFRLQARYRRAVTRRYLALPLGLAPAARHRHAAVQRQLRRRGGFVPIAPLPFAVGTVVMIVAAVVVAVRHRLGARAGRGGACSRRCSRSTCVYSRRMSPRQIRAQRMRAKVSAVAHESFDGALVVKTMGREADETAPVRRVRARAARRADRGRPAARAVRPGDGQPAQPRHAGRAAARRVAAAAPGAITRQRAGQRRVPVHRAGVPGAGDRLGARRAAAQRRGLGPGAGACSAADGDMRVRRRRRCPRRGPGRAALRRRRLRGTATAPPVLHDVSLHRAGRADGGAGRRRPAPASRRSPRWRSGWSTRTTGTVTLDGVDVRRADRGRAGRDRGAGAAGAVRLRRHRPRQRQRWTGRHRRRGGVARRCGWPQADGFVGRAARRPGHHGRRAGHLALRRAAAAAHPGPGAGRPAAAAGARRRHQRGRPAGRGGHPGRRCAAGDAPARRSWWWRTGGPPSRSPTRWSTWSTAGSWRAGTHTELLATVPGYADLVTAYERAEAERSGAASTRRACRRAGVDGAAECSDGAAQSRAGRGEPRRRAACEEIAA